MSQTTAMVDSPVQANGGRHLNGQLIHAYEQERLRIARDGRT